MSQSRSVSEALATRQSVRAFRPDPVPRALVEDILTRAARAPSGGNLQPWRVYVAMGKARDELVARVAELRKQHPLGTGGEYNIYPPDLFEPYRTRRFKLGEMMYATMGIGREDKAGRIAAFGRNWEFFGAPVGFIFTMDRRMEFGQWVDLGLYMQSIMLLAREQGLDTCPQESWSQFQQSVREFFAIPGNELVFCGMALGWRDDTAPVNGLVSERAQLSEFATFRE
ncbi:MAG: nitroreductase [Alphaproteobacteria bacterium]|nr:nitroreductase [Alphaproteobacteria bacterium]MDE2072433.1 nitroreductase [Alphaproteobacteria bacterium]